MPLEDSMIQLAVPVVPAGITIIVNMFAPAAIALINRPAWPTGSKRLVSYGVSIVLSLVAIWGYYATSGEPVPNLLALIGLGIVVSQAAFTTVRGQATRLEARHGLLDK